MSNKSTIPSALTFTKPASALDGTVTIAQFTEDTKSWLAEQTEEITQMIEKGASMEDINQKVAFVQTVFATRGHDAIPEGHGSQEVASKWNSFNKELFIDPVNAALKRSRDRQQAKQVEKVREDKEGQAGPSKSK